MPHVSEVVALAGRDEAFLVLYVDEAQRNVDVIPVEDDGFVEEKISFDEVRPWEG